MRLPIVMPEISRMLAVQFITCNLVLRVCSIYITCHHLVRQAIHDFMSEEEFEFLFHRFMLFLVSIIIDTSCCRHGTLGFPICIIPVRLTIVLPDIIHCYTSEIITVICDDRC